MTAPRKETTHFLVVDDDPDSRLTILDYLRSMGFHRVSVAKDGAEAARLIEKDSSINFVISDWEMPRMNGLTLLQRVRAKPDRGHIPFLICTSPVSEEAEKVVLAAESLVDAYLIKPFRMQLLQEKIDMLMRKMMQGPRRKTVVVDDDPDARQMVIEYLQHMGVDDIQAFDDPKAALAFLQKNAHMVGLVISDWEMPAMSGLDLLRTCKNSQALAEIPFLMVTSQSSMERMKVMQAARANVDDYLLKPFSSSDLKARIGTLQEKAAARSKIARMVYEAKDHMEHGRFQRALALLEQALELDPEHDIVLRALGDCTVKTRGMEAAVPYYKRCIEASPMNPKGYLKLAEVYEQLRMLDQAIALLRTANSQIGFNSELHFQLGWIYHKKGMVAEAKAEFEKTLEIQLDHQEARLMLEMINAGRRK